MPPQRPPGHGRRFGRVIRNQPVRPRGPRRKKKTGGTWIPPWKKRK